MMFKALKNLFHRNKPDKYIDERLDERLEALSDLVRQGIPIDFAEALEVITYQRRLKEGRNGINTNTIVEP